MRHPASRSNWFWTAAISLALAVPLAAQQSGPTPPPPPNIQQAAPAATAAQQVVPPQEPADKPVVKKSAGTITVPSGTRLPLVLHNAVTTRNARPGDPIYLETLFPIVQDNKILIPAGSYVQGEILEAKRPGKVMGQGELRVRLNTLILPNGYTVNFNAVPTNAGTGGNESTDSEGKVKGDTDKAADVGTVMKTTAAGAGIGAIAGRSGKGAGIGAGVGAAVGLAAVLLTRGPELELPRGTTLDIVLDRALYLDASYINFTDPGRASTIPGAPNREPTRSKSPF
jgi:hypothetical protein